MDVAPSSHVDFSSLSHVDFSSLSPEQKHDLVTKLIHGCRHYREYTVGGDRHEKRDCAKWASHLFKKELMMIGEFDQEEVDSIISPSLEKSMLMWDLDSEEEEKLHQEYRESFRSQKKVEGLDIYEDEEDEEEEEEEEYYVPQTFEQHLHVRKLDEVMECLTVEPSSYKGEYFVDREKTHLQILNSAAYDGKLEMYVLQGHTENLIQMDAQEYQEKMEKIRGRQKRRFV